MQKNILNVLYSDIFASELFGCRIFLYQFTHFPKKML